MANLTRKPLTFNVSQPMYERVTALFPNPTITGKPDCSEATLTAILDAYEHPSEAPTDLLNRIHQAEQANELLQKENAELQAKYAELNALHTKLSDDLNSANQTQTESENTITYLNNQKALLQGENSELKDKITSLENTIQALSQEEISWDKIKTTLKPFTVALLEETAKRLSQKQDRQIEPMQILTDMFLRYTIQRWNEWFYKFCLSDRDIVAIAQSVNPHIKNISQIKLLLK